jgi:hypothetical protein
MGRHELEELRCDRLERLLVAFGSADCDRSFGGGDDEHRQRGGPLRVDATVDQQPGEQFGPLSDTAPACSRRDQDRDGPRRAPLTRFTAFFGGRSLTRSTPRFTHAVS